MEILKKLKRKKIFFVCVLLAAFLLIISWRFYNKKNKLPNQYKNFHILKEESTELNYSLLLESGNSVLNTRIIVINNQVDMPTVLGLSKILLLREDGYFLELPGYGEGFEWWKVGDLNDNGYFDIAVLYQNMGSGSFQPFYFYEWNGENFEVELQNSDLFNWDELADLDNDGRMEIVHEFRVSQFAWPWKEIYKWDEEKREFIKANNLFHGIYEEWLKDKELNPDGNFQTLPEFWESQDGQTVLLTNQCLKEKAVLNSKGIFADIDVCYNL
ncbi:MAG: VCBS repeat-containing protein [bacterium]